MKPIRAHAVVACCLALLLAPLAAPAADHYNLEAGLPTELTDTIPIDYRNTEVQGFLRWQHTREGREEFHLVPRLEYGLFPNAQLEIEAPYEFGEAVDDDEFKRLGVELLYNINQEGLYFPAIALAGRADIAVGDEVDGTDATAKLILSKTIGRSARWQRLHLNASWTRIDEQKEDEREDLYAFIVGYDRLVSPDAILILDFVRRQERERGTDSNLLEVGMRYQCTPLTVIAWGVGAGVGADSPDFRATIGFQHSFNGWFLR